MPAYLNEEDISPVVCRLKRAKPEARAKLANDRSTRAFIAAGVSLIQKQLGGPDEAESSHETSRDLLGWLSQRAVIAEAAEIGETDANDGKLRDRWRKHSDYIADLIAYVLWSERLKLDRMQAGLAIAELNTTDPVLLTARVHEVAYSDLTAMVATAAYKFQLVAAATATNDPVLAPALRKMYEAVLDSWLSAYQKTLDSLGLRLRPGISLLDVANLLAAVAEGLGLHLLADPDAPIKDDDRRTCLLGTAALSIIVSCTAPPGDNRSLEEFAQEFLSSAGSGAESS